MWVLSTNRGLEHIISPGTKYRFARTYKLTAYVFCFKILCFEMIEMLQYTFFIYLTRKISRISELLSLQILPL